MVAASSDAATTQLSFLDLEDLGNLALMALDGDQQKEEHQDEETADDLDRQNDVLVASVVPAKWCVLLNVDR